MDKINQFTKIKLVFFINLIIVIVFFATTLLFLRVQGRKIETLITTSQDTVNILEQVGFLRKSIIYLNIEFIKRKSVDLKQTNDDLIALKNSVSKHQNDDVKKVIINIEELLSNYKSDSFYNLLKQVELIQSYYRNQQMVLITNYKEDVNRWKFNIQIIGGILLLLVTSLIIASIKIIKFIADNFTMMRLQKQLLDETQKMGRIGSFQMNISNKDFLISNTFYKIIKAEDCKGSDVKSIIHDKLIEGEREKFIDLWDKMILGESKIYNEFTFSNGSVYLISCFLDDEGAVCKGFIQDISDRVNAENAVKIQQEYISRSSNLTLMGEVSAGIGHEINNPLTIISLRNDQIKNLVLNKTAESEKILKYSEEIKATIGRIVKIVKGLQVLSRDSSTDPKQDVFLTDIIESSKQLCADKASKNGVIFINHDKEIQVFSVYGRETQLAQVFVNLISNSIDAVKDLTEKWISIELAKNQELIEIKISDSGKGISDIVVKKMMDPFFTTKEVGKGTGLGLSIVTRIIEDHNGRFFYNKNSKNTEFIIHLPLTKEQNLVPFSAQDAIDAHVKWKQRLLSYFVNPDGQLDSEVICKDNNCSLGKWIYSYEVKYSTNKEFIHLKDIHAKFHLCAGNLVKRLHQGEKLSGELFLGKQSQYNDISNQTISSIQAFEKHLVNSNKKVSL